VTAALVVVAVVVVVLAVLVVAQARAMGQERRAWTEERRALVDRAIAAHTGEVLALDKARGGRVRPERERPLIEGMS
jgi:hypothetical protein